MSEQDRLNSLYFDISNNYSSASIGNEELDPDTNFWNNLNIDSSYYTSETFVSKFKDCADRSCFSCIHFNSRSLPKNFDAISTFLNLLDYEFDVIGISETWLQDDNAHDHNLSNYSFFGKNRTGRTGGGVGIYIRNTSKYFRRPELQLNENLCDSVFIELRNEKRGKNIIAGVVYKPPNVNSSLFIDAIESLLHGLLAENKLIYIMGDFNIDLLKYDETRDVQNLVDSLISNYCVPLIVRPTRITNATATLLDNVFTNQLEMPCVSGILYTDITDHLPIFQITSIDYKCLNVGGNSSPEHRVFSKQNIDAFRNALTDCDWNDVLRCGEVNSAYNCFEMTLRDLYDKHFPLQLKHQIQQKKLKPWMTETLLKSVRHKNKLYKRFLHKPSEAHGKEYRQFRNKLNAHIKKVKRDYYQEKFSAVKNDIKCTWKVINSMIGKRKDDGEETQMKCNGSLTDNSLDIANTFNCYFTGIGPQLASSIQDPEIHFSEYLSKSNSNSIYFYPTNETEICNIVNLFKSNKASGLDDFSPSIIKSVIGTISKPLCHIYNMSMNEGIFPDKLKIARVTPIYKKGDKSEVSNYRPISVLSCFSKILEKIIYKRVITFLDKNDILSKNQFGFRNKYSTSMALVDICNKIVDTFEENSFMIGIFIDLSKAFDTINHSIMLSKLRHYGIRGIAYNWFSSYLSNRCQCTKYKSSVSSLKQISCGVPQGSLLGPLLFILYINDIENSSPLFSFLLYADDTNIIYRHKDLNELQRQANDNLKKVSVWFRANKLSVNPQKCNFMIFSNRSRFHDLTALEINLNSVRLPMVEYTKFLGVYVDSKLSWKYHLREVEKKSVKKHWDYM